MAKNQPHSYITDLLQPIPQSSDKRAWSIPIAGVWCPFFTATNATGQTAIDPDVLGAPLRLQYEKDGTPKFGKSGKPVIRVARELSDNVRMVRENFTAGLLSYVAAVRKDMPDAFKAQAEAAMQAGEAVVARDNEALVAYILAQIAATTPAESAESAEAEAVLAAA